MIKILNFFKKTIWPLEQINKALPLSGLILDLGCGEGLISRYLSEKSKTREVVGVDLDTKRLPKTAAKNLKFINSDIQRFRVKTAAGFVISDVLHHLKFADQKRLLSGVAKRLEKEGVLIIKEIDSGEFLRSKFSRLWDLVLYPEDKINYWNAKDLKNYLIVLGFRVKIERSSRFFPGSTTLFICTK